MMKDHPEESTAYYSQQNLYIFKSTFFLFRLECNRWVLKLIHDSDNVAFFLEHSFHILLLYIFKTDFIDVREVHNGLYGTNKSASMC